MARKMTFRTRVRGGGLINISYKWQMTVEMISLDASVDNLF